MQQNGYLKSPFTLNLSCTIHQTTSFYQLVWRSAIQYKKYCPKNLSNCTWLLEDAKFSFPFTMYIVLSSIQSSNLTKSNQKSFLDNCKLLFIAFLFQYKIISKNFSALIMLAWAIEVLDVGRKFFHKLLSQNNSI